MDGDDQTIVEQEVEIVAKAVGQRLSQVLDWLQVNVLTLGSLYQSGKTGCLVKPPE